MKKLLTVLLTILVLTGCTTTTELTETEESTTSTFDKSNSKIGIIQLMDHTSLNIIYDSFKEELYELGYTDDNIEFINANGDLVNVENAVNQLMADKVDTIVGITTPVAQYTKKVADEIPVTFAAVSDPLGAGLVTSLEEPGNMTGTSSPGSVSKIMDLALEFVPNAKIVGYLYNPGEDNSVSSLDKLKEYAAEHDLEIIESPVSSFADLQTAAAVLANKVDFVYTATDNTVASGMQVVAEEVKKANKLVFVGADSMVMDGGFASVGIDYSDLGKENALIVDEILNGTAVSDIPVKVFNTDLNIYINQAYVQEFSIVIPDNILNNSKYIAIN